MGKKIPVLTYEGENSEETFEITVLYDDGGVMVKMPEQYNGRQILTLSKAGRNYLATHPEINMRKICEICFKASC